MRRLAVVAMLAVAGWSHRADALSQCHASAGTNIAMVYCSSAAGAGVTVRAHANCSSGAHRDGPWVTGVNQTSQTSCWPARVVSYGYHMK